MKLKFDQQVTFLTTDKMAESIEFYERILRLELVMDQGGCRIYRVSGDAFLGICERKRHEDDCKHLVFTFVTDKVDQWYEMLKSQDVNITKTPAFNPEYNIYHMFFRDPNGYLLEIQEFKDPSWPN
jgi:catechol 2,3-dioxygenase-like lactoylglutathione lyase family enzyme